ncbi:polysaccharide biosynthesis C-terminal domain-containing protein [Oceanobacillus senegalensis]|uniref:oligosaccharide flippase family protein n=1 Tax=Oceanobacillus senegalensis TaxID=1936063 RepID=UPI000A30F8C4|nr:polysaccharide biosynthesis C-terminal domain-containing protein [Oceanobacillus senegalensis]
MISKLLSNDYSLSLINKIYSMLLGLLSSIFLTRYLGVVYKGDYAYITQLVAVLTIVFGLGLNQSYSFFRRKKPNGTFEKYVNFYFSQLIIHTLLAIILGFLLSNSLLFIYVCILLPFSVLKQQMASTVTIENIRLGIKLQMFNASVRMFSFLILFLFAESSLLLPVLITVGINIISVFIYIYFLRVIPRPLNTNFTFMKEVIKFSWLPMLTSLLITFNYSIDIFFLKSMGTQIELGLYATAAGIINYFWLIPDSFKEVLASRVARKYSTKSTILTIKISVFSVFMVILAFIFFGKFAIELMYGSEFVNSYKVTIILSFGAISMVFYKMIGVVLLAEGKRWIYFIVLLISVILNIIANILTIPTLGMYGAAISSVASYSICGISFLAYYMWDKKIKIKELISITVSDIKLIGNALKRR